MVSTLYIFRTESNDSQTSRATAVAKANASTLIMYVYFEANSGFKANIESYMRICAALDIPREMIEAMSTI